MDFPAFCGNNFENVGICLKELPDKIIESLKSIIDSSLMNRVINTIMEGLIHKVDTKPAVEFLQVKLLCLSCFPRKVPN